MTPITFDSSALVALLTENDADHEKAVAISRNLVQESRPVLLPSEVLAESLNIIGKKYGLKAAVERGRYLVGRVKEGALLVPHGGDAVVQGALDKLAVQPQSVSYIDCLVMAYADHYQTKEIFGFDAAFRKNGYRLPVTLAEGREAA